jgi:hypothetical protein
MLISNLMHIRHPSSKEASGLVGLGVHGGPKYGASEGLCMGDNKSVMEACMHTIRRYRTGLGCLAEDELLLAV